MMSTVISANVSVKGFGVVADNGVGYSIWSAPYTEKIIQDTHLKDYSDMQQSAVKVDLDMAKAETETAQIVITANNPVSSYSMKANDLTNANGDVLSKENVDFYSAMYVRLGYLYNDMGFSTGSYIPDTMLPLEKAVEYGENTVEKDKNQSIYISVTTDDEQPAGKYTGNFELMVNGNKHNVPVTVNVRNVLVNTTVTSKSIFLDSWTHNLGEYDSSQRMTDQYHKALMDYRLAPNKLSYDVSDNQESAEYYAQKVWEMYEYGSDEEKFGEGADRFSNFMFPFTLANADITRKNMLLYGNEIVKLSCEKGIDFVERAVVYWIDEPEACNNFEGNKVAHNNFVAARDAWVESIENSRNALKITYDVSDEFITKLVASAGKLQNIVTQSYMEKYDGYIDTWCPLFRSYNSPSHVAKYKEQDEELWWYGCISTKAPLPTYHVDDILLSPRLESWLKAQYGVTGNLYWAVDQWTGYHIINGERQYRYTDDYYSEAGPYDGVGGEGYLFRPGKKYGIDGPIPTIRLDAIRDGLEEFELMETLKDVYETTGKSEGRNFDAMPTINDLMSTLASGMNISATTSTFDAARTLLLDLSEFAAEGVCFTGFVDDGRGNLKYEIYVPDGVNLDVNNAGLLHSETLTYGKLKTYSVNLGTATSRFVTFKITTDNGEKTLRRSIPGAINVYDANTLISNITGSDIDVTTTKVVDASSIFAGKTGKFVQIGLKTIANSKGYQAARITADWLKNIGAETQKVVFVLYYTGTETLPITINVKYKNKLSLTNEWSGSLNTGANEIIWGGLSTKNWSVGEIEFIQIHFGAEISGTALPQRTDIYLESIAIYEE